MRCLPIFALAVAALGCESTYHPEYHPVTVTTVHQAYSQPAVVTNSGTSTPVVVMPPTPPPAVIQNPPVADPDAFFHDPP